MPSLHYSLEHVAYQLRRLSILATTTAGSGHPTSCLSAADIVAALFFDVMNYDPCNPHLDQNDHFILSKGHAAPLLYAAWCELGIISEKELLALRTFNSPLEGHPTSRALWNEGATGSLGQGLSLGIGYALAARFTNSAARTYVLLGDSELAEGSIWEAVQLAAYYQLASLIGIVDLNGLGQSNETMLDHQAEKCALQFAAFGWNTIVINGHNMPEILRALHEAQTSSTPTMIIAKTIKGFGIPSVAGKQGFHGKVFSRQELPSILSELATQFPAAAAAHHEERNNTCSQPVPARQYEVAQIPLLHTEVPAESCATRKAFGQALVELGKHNKKCIVLDAEVKNSTYTELFAEKVPDQFVECFIAEQNMISIATGLALQGFIPFAATFAAFLTRAHDQLRMAAIGKVPLRIIGSHAGVSIGEDGPSQMGLEDIALMRTLPNSLILYPCDAVSTRALTFLMATYTQGISYLRTTREATPALYNSNQLFTIGGCSVIKQGDLDSVCIIAAGITVFEALTAAHNLQKENIHARVIDCYSIKPLPTEELLRNIIACNHKAIIVEDHYTQGGLGEAIISALCNHNIIFEHCSIKKLPQSGTPAELRADNGIDSQALQNKVKKILSLSH